MPTKTIISRCVGNFNIHYGFEAFSLWGEESPIFFVLADVITPLYMDEEAFDNMIDFLKDMKKEFIERNKANAS